MIHNFCRLARWRFWQISRLVCLLARALFTPTDDGWREKTARGRRYRRTKLRSRLWKNTCSTHNFHQRAHLRSLPSEVEARKSNCSIHCCRANIDVAASGQLEKRVCYCCEGYSVEMKLILRQSCSPGHRSLARLAAIEPHAL